MSLISITVDEDHSNYKSVDGVVYSKDGTQLVCCPAGKTGAFSVPDGVTGIGDEAFYFCMFVTSVTIPDSVTSIVDDAFYLCVFLTSVTIPDSVTGIGEDAFKGCRSLKSVTIPDSVTTIEYGTFRGCTSLASVTIPAGVTTVRTSAFDGCTSLAAFDVDDSNSDYKSMDGILYTKDGTELIRCPQAKTGAEEVPSGVYFLSPESFSECRNITSVIID